MGWEGLGGTISPGHSIVWEYWWADGYRGSDIAFAVPLTAGAVLRVYDHGMRMTDDGTVHYLVRVVNDGSAPASYRLAGTRTAGALDG